MHYDPRWGNFVNRHRNQFVMNKNYKLYADGRFFNIERDKLEKYPINTDSLSSNMEMTYKRLYRELNNHPSLK